MDVKEKWGVEGFDAVIGNPPYQPPSNNKKGGKSIWGEFVIFNLHCLKPSGLLLFIHPALWRKPENKLREIMFDKQIHYLSIHNDGDGLKYFGATTRYDYYLMENTKPYQKTIVRFEDGSIYNFLINLDLPFLPNFGWSIFEKILSKSNSDGLQVINDSDCHTMRPHVSKKEKEGFRYKLLNSISHTKGKTYYYSSRPHKNQKLNKVIFSNGRHVVPFYDPGELGVTQGGLYVIVDSEYTGKKIVSFLESKLIDFIVKATKWSNFETTRHVFHYIPNMIHQLDTMNDEQIFRHFQITEMEKKIIERHIR